MTKWLRFAPLAIGLIALGLLCWRFGLDDLGQALQHAVPAQLGLYLALSVAVVASHSWRWQLIARVLGTKVSLLRLIAARLAGDAVGGVVPSGKLAGEPVRIALVHADGLAGAEASAGVSIDRLVEMISNMLCFVAFVSVFSIAHSDSAGRTALVPVAVMIALFVALAILLLKLRRGESPLASWYGAGAPRWLQPFLRWMPALQRVEHHLVRFLREHTAVMVWGVVCALLTEGLVIWQYHTLLSAFGIACDLPTLLLALVGTGVARTLPMPAGLGALEASQVSVFALAAGHPEVGFVAGMVMRLHDTLWMIVGLAVLAARMGSLATLWRSKAVDKVAA